MAIMGFNPAAEMSQLRTQQSLAMQASAPAAGAAPAPAAAAAAAQGAAAPGAAADAAIGAAAVQEPPATSKIVLQSVLRGAMTGASVTMGLKSFGPTLMKVGFIGKLMGSTVPPTGVLGFLSKLPVVGKVLPLLGRTGLQGFLIAGLVGAGVGAVFGALSGMKKAKAAAAEYAEAMAAQQAQEAQQPPAGDPVNAPGPAPKPGPPAKPGGKRKAKSWVIARQGSTPAAGPSFGHYRTRKGDTIEQLAKRFYTTPAEIRKLNPDLGRSVEPGTKLKLRRKVVPDAKAWVA